MFLGVCLFITASCQYLDHRVPMGPNYYEKRWDQAVLLLKDQKYDEAEPVLKELYSAAQSASPELATRALFELGQINEKKGQWLTALSQFKECEGKKDQLPGFKAELELPSRLAGLYATLGELKTSELYARKVESNLQSYMQLINITNQKAWWAETFYRMGSFPVEYVNAENWKDFARRFHSTSQYLIRSMEQGDSVWSEKSLELAQTFFKKSLEFLTVIPSDVEENSVLLGSIVRERVNLLEEILQKIQLYKPLNVEKSTTVTQFYKLAEQYQAQVKTSLYQIKDSAPLSRESQKRNGIERVGKLINPSGTCIDKDTNGPKM